MNIQIIHGVMIAGGLIALLIGGEGLLRGSVSIARRMNLSKLFVSAVIIGFGTAMPELTVSVGAALKGSTEMALGNIIGSNIANILLILGCAALIFPLCTRGIPVGRDVMMLLASALILTTLLFLKSLVFVAGVGMLLVLAAYLVWSTRQDKKKGNPVQDHIEEDTGPTEPYGIGKAIVFCLIGLAALGVGAHFLVEGASAIARNFGVSEVVIGLTLVAIGTSLPELATAVVAAVRKHTDVVIGNILGSNAFNILAILGITAMVKPIPVPAHILQIDIWVMLGATALLAIALWRRWTIGRLMAVLMLAAYATYIISQY